MAARSIAIAIGQLLTVGGGRTGTGTAKSSLSPCPWCRLLPHRTQSSSSSSSSSDPLIRKLEDAIQRIIVRRSAPDWLPFLPGTSYWVPPPPSQPSHALAQLLHNLSSPNPNPVTPTPPHHHHHHQSMWPSSSYFTQGVAPHPLEVDTTTTTTIFDSDSNSQSQDDKPEE